MQDMAWHGKALYDTALQGNTYNCEEKKWESVEQREEEKKIDSMRKEKWWMMFFLFFLTN